MPAEPAWQRESADVPPAAGEAVAQAPGRDRMSTRAATMVSLGVVLVIAGAVALRVGKKPPPPVQKPIVPVVTAPAPTAAAPPAPAVPHVALPGVSVAVGLGTPLKPPAPGKVPRPVTADAVALLQLTLPKPRATVGDTVHVRLDAMDDAGKPVTTPQVYWSTSDPDVVRFAGPAQLIAVKEGKAMITVSAGSSTAAKELTVVVKKGKR